MISVSQMTGSRPVVLLVDDDPVNLALISAALEDKGFEVAQAGSGSEALDKLRGGRWSPDMIVLDAIMPGIDGFDTCQAMRQMTGIANLPVLMLTGLDDDASIDRAYRAGATDFFVKSTHWSLLAWRLRYMHESSRTFREKERNRAKLARVQEMAHIAGFDWWYGPDTSLWRGLSLSAEARRLLKLPETRPVPLTRVLRLLDAEDRRGLLRLMREKLRVQGKVEADLPVTLDGRSGQAGTRHLRIEAEPEKDDFAKDIGYSGFLQDITERRKAEMNAQRLANRDALTDLPNRRNLQKRIEIALQHAEMLGHAMAVLVIDIDRFKVINDNLGHPAGDALLIEVGTRLRGCVRHSERTLEDLENDTPGNRKHRSLEAVARLGGDEFVALLPEISGPADVERVAQRMLDALRAPIIVQGQECFASASIGAALFPRDATTFQEIIQHADKAMYEVKQRGRNGFLVYSRDMSSESGGLLIETEAALHKALERNELVLHYQPQIDVQSGRMIGVEALMRWEQNGRLVPPMKFLPIAEETGLIVPMTEWLIHEASAQIAKWRDEFGFAEHVAVNMPVRMFSRPNLLQVIESATSTAGIPLTSLVLEVTERDLMKDVEATLAGMRPLHEAGLEISLDDFGIEHSSLLYLATMPLSELKIDKVFVHGLGSNSQSSHITTAIIAMAKALKLRVMAEGVENFRQMGELHRQGCRLMQGFMFSKPMPGNEMQHWLQNTVLPKKAPWIGAVEGNLGGGVAVNAPEARWGG